MKIVIIGAGEVGYHIANSLYENNDVIIIDRDDDACERADEMDLQVIQGNGANVRLLTQVLTNADLLVAVTGSDEVNIVSCMAAKLVSKSKKPLKTMARVSNPDYIDKPVARRTQIGIDTMICPELAMASEVAEVLSIPSAIDAEFFAEGKVEMIEFVAKDNTEIVGKQIKNLQLSESCIISALFRGGEVIIPHGDDAINSGDHVVIIGKTDEMKSIRGVFGEIGQNVNKVMIIGGGKVGFHLAQIAQKSGIKVKIIERDKKRCEYIADVLPEVLVINGDGTDVNLLKEEEVSNMDTVFSVMGSDEKNLLSALLAKQFGVGKVITRVERSGYSPLFEMVGVDLAASPKQATINEVMKLSMGTGIEALTTIEGERAEIIEYIAYKNSKITGKPLKDIKFPSGAIVSMVIHGNEPFIPRGDHVIEDGDRVLIFSLPSAVTDVEKLFK
ncbi:Trk system potassium transporter TrkA [Methanohalobium sp.]|uniref:Trk system potassium transporter TrkA n=1 Tax=Methanohalobium sp. TaxID=2837493 RepID=UPI0025DC84D9|nr:Trk system potassium transporter TrkA [Methanohalobium sp.]